ncbi:uracil-DNA glycosylase [Candidatus Poribacteria bacterium]|nr:MAG: uracil-DNA glycosylase [Candidatus Poribacteria bacterium]
MSVAEEMRKLKERAMSCTDCDLHKTRTQVVFGEGNPEAKIVFVGEGPGENEDREGRPFVGRAGRLLNQVLEEIGLKREEVWITNVIKCRACTIDKDGRVKNRPPRVGEVNACKKWLDAELKLIKPTVIVCLGNPAANLLIHKGFKMLEERGRWFESSPYAPFIMATLHPAFVLRQKGEAFERARADLVNDLLEAKRKAESTDKRGGSQLTLF